MNNRTPLLFALLLLLFFVSTSAGFANFSAIQDQLRGLQLKVIGEKLKILQQGVLGVTTTPPKAASPLPPLVKEITAEELSATLKAEIKTLEGIVITLKPQAMDEEAVRIEKQLAEIQKEAASATGDELFALRERLSRLTSEQAALEQNVRKALEDSLKYRQVLIIRDQIKLLQEKVDVLPRAPTGPAAASVPATSSTGPSKEQLTEVQNSIDKLRLKLLQAQVKAIQEKIKSLAY